VSLCKNILANDASQLYETAAGIAMRLIHPPRKVARC